MIEEKKQNGNGALVSKADAQQMLQQFETRLELVSQMKGKALQYLKPEDVVDQGGKPYILESGSVGIIAKGFQIHITNIKGPFQTTVKHEGEPDEIIFSYTADCSTEGLGSIVAQGVCSTRDGLLGTANGEAKGLNKVDFPSVMNKAMTNLRNTAVKHFMGLTNLTWKELEEHSGIKKDQCVKVEYYSKQKRELSEEGKEIKEKIREMLKVTFESDKKKAMDYLEKMTTWEKDGKTIKGKRNLDSISEAQLQKVIYPDLKIRYEEAMKGPFVDPGDVAPIFNKEKK
jgi:hypothetical protein